jgi:hypothetical protein
MIIIIIIIIDMVTDMVICAQRFPNTRYITRQMWAFAKQRLE